MSSKTKGVMLAVAIRLLTITLIIISIAITYYVKVVQKDYIIYTNPDGPETEDYFEELGLINIE